MSRRTLGRVSALIAAVALAGATMTACSEQSQDAAGSGGDTIKIGTMTAVGSGLSNYPDIQAGAEAAVKQINADGGVNGKKLELDFCNTQADANKAQACARQLDSDGVVATVGRIDLYDAQVVPILAAAKIPDIGASSNGADIDYKSPNFFPLQPGNFGSYTALPYAFKNAGKKSMVVVAVDTPNALAQGAFAEKVAANIGLEVKPQIKVPIAGVTDYSPYVQQAINSGADSITLIIGPAAFQSFVKSGEALGLKALIGGSGFAIGQSEAAGMGALADKILVVSPYPSVDDKTNTGIAQYQKELDADSVAKDNSVRRYAGLNAWLAVHAAADVAKKISGTVTRASMTKALEAAKGIDLYGLASYSPSTLTNDLSSNAFGRFPAVPYYVETFKDGLMVDAGQSAIPDPLSTVR